MATDAKNFSIRSCTYDDFRNITGNFFSKNVIIEKSTL